jgi:hypothetical protein
VSWKVGVVRNEIVRRIARCLDFDAMESECKSVEVRRQQRVGEEMRSDSRVEESTNNMKQVVEVARHGSLHFTNTDTDRAGGRLRRSGSRYRCKVPRSRITRVTRLRVQARAASRPGARDRPRRRVQAAGG